jgi:hypothetical protein
MGMFSSKSNLNDKMAIEYVLPVPALASIKLLCESATFLASNGVVGII